MVESTYTALESPFIFGPFEFHPTQRLLSRAGKPIRVGSRARELLLALLENAGTVIKKRTLLERVWPHTVVEDGTLRVHIADLRKILGNGPNGPHYIEN